MIMTLTKYFLQEAALELKDRLQQSLGIVGRQQQGMNLQHKLVNQGRRPSGPYNPVSNCIQNNVLFWEFCSNPHRIFVLQK
jgi:hypothetical protein